MSWLSKLFPGRKRVTQPLNSTVTFPAPPALPGFPALPLLPGMTVHESMRAELSFEVPCVLRPPNHKLRIIVVDKVIKAIVSPCSRAEAVASSALSDGGGCGDAYTGIVDRLRGSTRWGRFSETDDKMLNQAYRQAAEIRSRREAARDQHDYSFRIPPSLWPRFIKKCTGLNSTVGSINTCVQLEVETQPPSLYRFDSGTWGLAGGPGDRTVGELLRKYIKLNGHLARYVVPQDFAPSQSPATGSSAWQTAAESEDDYADDIDELSRSPQ